LPKCIRLFAIFKWIQTLKLRIIGPGNTKGEGITVPLTSCLTGLDYSVLQIKTKIVSCYAADSKPVKQEVNGTLTLILPPLVFPEWTIVLATVPPPLGPQNIRLDIRKRSSLLLGVENDSKKGSVMLSTDSRFFF
jgi:hypothetical protein